MCNNIQNLFYKLCILALFFSGVESQTCCINHNNRTRHLYPNNFYNISGVGFLTNTIATRFRCYEKPILKMPVISRDVLRKQVFLDYENILRSHDPEQINYNTRLSSIPGLDITNIDNLYGRIYDRKVLLKQINYFLEQDDFHTIFRILRDNPSVLTRVDCCKLVNSFPFIIKKVLKYPDLNINNIDEQVRFLVGRYVLHHVIHQLPRETCKYCNLTNGQVPGEPVENANRDFKAGGQIPIEEHPEYAKIINSFNTMSPELKFERAVILQRKMIEAKRKKLEKALWNFQKLKDPKHLSTRRKTRNHVNVKRVNPLISRPLRYTEEQYKQANEDFATAVNKEDIVTACYILQRYTRLLDFRYNKEILAKFMVLNKKVHQCGLYPKRSLENMRMLYWRTVKMPRVLLKLREYSVLRDIHFTPRELYERELEAYRKRRDEKNIEKMKAEGFDVNEINDFSNAYGEDWVPVIRPEEYKSAVEFARKRAETIKKLFESQVEEDLEKYSK